MARTAARSARQPPTRIRPPRADKRGGQAAPAAASSRGDESGRPRAPQARAGRRPARGTRPTLLGTPRRWIIAGAAAVVVVALAMYAVFGRVRGGGSEVAALATLKTADFHALAFAPDNPDVVFFGHHNGIMRSDDAGKTWQALVDRRNFDAMGLGVGRGDTRTVYLAGHDVFQASTDGGKTWQPVQHNLPGTDIHGFAMSPSDPNRLYAYVVGQGTFTSTDGGRTWQRLAGQLPGDVMGLADPGSAGASPGAPETLYASSMGAGVLRSADGGQTWNSAMGALGRRGVLALAADPAAPQTLYAGLEGSGLYKTADGGGTWTRLPFPGQSPVAIAVSPAQPQRVLAIEFHNRAGLVYRSDDGGATWGGR